MTTLLARLTDYTRPRERRAFRARFVLGYALSYVLDAGLLALFAAAGTVAPWVPIAYGVTGLGVCCVFYFLLITGASERFRDPHLTIFQTLASSAVVLTFFWLAPQIRVLFLSVLLIVVGFGSLRLSWRQGLFCCAVIAASTFTVVHGTPDSAWLPYSTPAEITLVWIWFLFTLARLMALGLVGNSIRMVLV